MFLADGHGTFLFVNIAHLLVVNIYSELLPNIVVINSLMGQIGLILASRYLISSI